MIFELAHHLKSQDERIEREEARYENLFSELISALIECDPGRVVRTPGWGEGKAPAFDVFHDELCGRNADDMRGRVAYIVGCAAKQTGDGALQEMALKLLTDIAHQHADWRSS